MSFITEYYRRIHSALSLRNFDKKLLKIILGIYIPSFFVQIGTSLAMPFNPLYSRELGADFRMIGLIAAAGGVGHLIFDIPSGWLAGRIKAKRFLQISVAGLVVFILLKGLIQSPWQLLGVSVFIGMFQSAWGIGRLTYIHSRVPPEYRGRTLANMAGIMRLSRIISPFLGGLLIRFLGFRIIFFIQSALALGAFFLLSGLLTKNDPGRGRSHPPRKILSSAFRKNGKNISVSLLGMTGLQLIRMSRNLLFPLWAASIGVSVELIGALTSLGGFIETAMVIPVGHLLDKIGRKRAAVSCLTGLSVSLCLLPFASGVTGLALVFSLMAFSNGLGTGINMTISSDLAPPEAASEFLGMWRFATDTSLVTGPALVGYISGIFALSLAPFVAGGIGLSASLVLMVFMKETKEQH